MSGRTPIKCQIETKSILDGIQSSRAMPANPKDVTYKVDAVTKHVNTITRVAKAILASVRWSPLRSKRQYRRAVTAT